MEILKKGDVNMEEPEKLATIIEKLMKEICEMKEEQQKIINQISISRDISGKTDNVKNLRLICNDLADTSEHIIEKDMKLFEELYGILKTLSQFPW